MAGMTEDIVYRLNWMRDEQSRTNLAIDGRLKMLEDENKDIRARLTVLTRLLIAKQVASAEEIATALAAAIAPPVTVDPSMATAAEEVAISAAGAPGGSDQAPPTAGQAPLATEEGTSNQP